MTGRFRRRYRERPPAPPVAQESRHVRFKVPTGVRLGTAEQHLRALCERFGKCWVWIAVEAETGVLSGWAVVSYRKCRQAERAMAGLAEKKLLGEPVKCSPYIYELKAVPAGEAAAALHVGFICPSLGRIEACHALRSLCEKVGEVRRVALAMRGGQETQIDRHRCFGYVTMGSPEEARAAIALLEGRVIGERALRASPFDPSLVEWPYVYREPKPEADASVSAPDEPAAEIELVEEGPPSAVRQSSPPGEPAPRKAKPRRPKKDASAHVVVEHIRRSGS